MNYTKAFFILFIIGAMFFLTQTTALAATLPLPGVDIVLKSILSGQIFITKTDNGGNFNANVPEENEAYYMFINDESISPIKILAKKGIISGRVVILTDGTTTKDLVSLPVKKVTPIKKSKPIVPKQKN